MGPLMNNCSTTHRVICSSVLTSEHCVQNSSEANIEERLGVLIAIPPQSKGGTQYAFVRRGTPPSLHADDSHFLEAKEIGDVCARATVPPQDLRHYHLHIPRTILHLKCTCKSKPVHNHGLLVTQTTFHSFLCYFCKNVATLVATEIQLLTIPVSLEY